MPFLLSLTVTLSSIHTWFSKLGFWKRLIIIFTINTIIILMVMDALILILFDGVDKDIEQIVNNDKQEFIQLSNSQVAKSIGNLLLKNF